MDSETLLKAVAAHRAYVQQRSRAGKFLRFDPRRETARDAGGRFAKRLTAPERAEAERLARREIDYLDRHLKRHLGDLQKGRLSAPEAARRGAEDIAEYYERVFRGGLQAAGNPGILLTPRDKAALSRVVRDEQDFWLAFMDDVAAGRGTMDYARRQEMYTRAANEAYWLGWVLGDLRPSRRIFWDLGDAEHCEKCVELHARGKGYKPREFLALLGKGYTPQSGALPCRTNCHCKLREEILDAAADREPTRRDTP